MSTIYSAGQYDDAFTPKKLGNWESTAKESYPFRKSVKLHTPKIIVDSRGHLLPWVPRGDRSSSWGLLNMHLLNKYNRTQSMVFMSGPGKKTSSTNTCSANQSTMSIQKRLKKLPRFAPRKVDNLPPPDLLLEYLQHLSLPIVWIIGPSTRNTFQKRKQFSKQLASSLGFGYVNLDEKIQEWKERQQICTCGSNSFIDSCGMPPTSPPHGPLHSLASTSIAPSKLPTNVPPFISPNIPSPPQTSAEDANEYLLNILESQRITFDTALPIERNKILELYKFAMAECLPCEGFIMDSVPFDLVEGIQFEKIFYPAALAIYFTEGVPQRKQKQKPKDRRVTASTATSIQSAKKILMSPLDYLERSKKQNENVYLRTKSHKRLGVFNLAEGEKICKQFGCKTIRIINAEDVERDTMEFLNVLVKKNLDRYQDIIKGNAKLDMMGGIGRQLIPCSSAEGLREPPSPAYSSAFITEDDEKLMEENEDLERMARFVGKEATVTPFPPSTNMPPALVTAHQSETSLFTLPNIFSTSESSSNMSSSVEVTPRSLPIESQENHSNEELVVENTIDVAKHKDNFDISVAPPSIAKDTGGDGDQASTRNPLSISGGRSKSAELWEKITKLESKVAELGAPEETGLVHSSPQQEDTKLDPDFNANLDLIDRIPPPTAYAEQEEYLDKEEEEKFTAAIRNAIGPQYVTAASIQEHEYLYAPHQNYQSQLPVDYGASGDCGHKEIQEQFQPHPHFQQQHGNPLYLNNQQRKTPPKEYKASTDHDQQNDPFYD